MEIEDLLARAWKAVLASGVPTEMRETAFKGALALLVDESDDQPKVQRQQERAKTTRRAPRTRQGEQESSAIDEGQFFANLAEESGVEERDLRDVLHLSGGKVQVSAPTRKLGTSQADQARTVTALVAGGRFGGLGESPVNANEVREEVRRKKCYQQNNYASKHLATMKGFNAGPDQSQMLTTSKWVDEFAAAIDLALERSLEGDAD